MRCAGRGRRRSCAAVAAKVARLSFTTRHGGIGSVQAQCRPHIGPDRGGDRLGGLVHHAVGGADGDRDMAALDEHPLRRAADQADEAGRAGSASTRNGCSGSPRTRSATVRPGSRSPATQGGTASTTASTGTERDRWSSRAATRRRRRHAQRRDPLAEQTRSRAPAARRWRDRPGSRKGLRAATAGMQAAPPRSSVSLTTAPSRRAEPCSGGVFSAAIASGSISRRIKRVRAAARPPTVASPAHAAQPAAARDSRAACVPGTRRPGEKIHHGMRPSVRAHVQRAPLLTSMKGKQRLVRHGQRLPRADPVEIGEGRAIARQQQVVAVIDAQPSSRSK